MKDAPDDGWAESARRWAAGDCDPDTAAQCLALAEGADVVTLREHFGGSLQFGTAGLRAKVGPGPLRMNAAVVRKATYAVAQYVRGLTGPIGRVIVGFDARHSSQALAREAVGVLVGAGIDVTYFAAPTATPLVAHALRHCAGAAAIVITASHNPREYNGYKLYAGNGVQIVPPTDREIARVMELSPAAKDIPCVSLVPLPPGVHVAGPDVTDAYFAALRGAFPFSQSPRRRALSVVYTPLHGVGLEPVKRVLSEAGFSNVEAVAQQAQPDGGFPTVAFPNPEEPGVLDMAHALAESLGADVVIANDPDVDRLSASARDRAGRLTQLSGNQLGILLADECLRRHGGGPTALVVQSIVSSPMLASIAGAYDAHCERTLTGFKWIWNAAIALSESHGMEFVFGYEEALGYSVGDWVRDKDGISAALAFCELAAERKATGSSVWARMEELYRQHGLWVSAQHNVMREGPDALDEMERAVEVFASSPPSQLQGIAVTGLRDFRSGAELRPIWLGESSLIEVELGALGRALLRPSGTEPKLKIYVDLRRELSHAESMDEAMASVQDLARQVAAAVAERTGLL